MQKNDSNRGREYWKFDQFSSQMRKSAIKLYAEKVIAHASVNGEICCQGFRKELVDKAAQFAPLLKITCNGINNKVRNIGGLHEQQEIPPATPNHAIGYPTLSTDLDSSVSFGLISKRTSAENPLEF
jgi:hypothetical protein